MNADRRKRLRSLALFAALAGCAPIPALTFVADGVDSGTKPGLDATLPESDAGAADEGGDESPPDQPSDDAGEDAAPTIACGTTLVTDCIACPGAPLHCKKGTRNECVSSCVACAAGWFPCVHCATPDAAPHGSCLEVGTNGQIACAATNLCGCSVDTDCLAIAGSAQTCNVVKGKKSCETCGAPTTANTSCVSGSGAMGTCQISDGAAPKCD